MWPPAPGGPIPGSTWNSLSFWACEWAPQASPSQERLQGSGVKCFVQSGWVGGIDLSLRWSLLFGKRPVKNENL